MDPLLYDYSQNAKTYSVRYVEQPEDKLINRYIEAIANDQGSDLLLIPENLSVPLRDYVARFPDGYISEKVYKDKFVRSTRQVICSKQCIRLSGSY